VLVIKSIVYAALVHESIIVHAALVQKVSFTPRFRSVPD
jgi:hypothetical protein